MVCVVWERLPSSYDAVASEYEATFLDELDGKPRTKRCFGTSSKPRRSDCGSWLWPGPGWSFRPETRSTVIGVDISAEMARLASGRLDGALVSDIRQLPLAGSSLGGVVAFYSSSIFHERSWAWHLPRSIGCFAPGDGCCSQPMKAKDSSSSTSSSGTPPRSLQRCSVSTSWSMQHRDLDYTSRCL